MQPNPYTPGEVARDVPGRDHQLAEIGERLSYMTQLQRLVGRIRVDHAPRGVGKTSLLRRAQHQAEELGAVTFWVTAGEAIGLVPAMAEEVDRVSRGWRADGRGRVRTALERLEVKVTGGVPGVAPRPHHRHARPGRRPDLTLGRGSPRTPLRRRAIPTQTDGCGQIYVPQGGWGRHLARDQAR